MVQLLRRALPSLRFLFLAGLLAGAPSPAAAQEDSALAEGALAPAIARAKAVEAEFQALAEKTSPAFLVVGGGSGALITADGWALTNHHVVSSRQVGDRWWVRRGGGERLRATLVGIDPRGDIAILKCESAVPLPFLPLADSDALEIGDMVIALGNPYGFATRDAAPTVTLGIVSAVHANRQNYSDAIQTDAAINPGNSGGPLVNRAGELIGINGRVAVRFGNRMNTGVGYAIPSNQIRMFLPKLKAGGTVAHGWVPGVTLVDTADGGGAGALVEQVTKGGAAETMGLRAGDVIVKVGDRPVRTPSAYFGAIGAYPAGAAVPLVVQRDGAERAVEATLVAVGTRSSDEEDEAPVRGWLGVRLRVVAAGGQGGGAEGAEGLLEVLEAVEGGPAAKAGLEKGDALLKIRSRDVRTIEEVGRALARTEPGTKIEVTVRRGGAEKVIEITLGKAP